MFCSDYHCDRAATPKKKSNDFMETETPIILCFSFQVLLHYLVSLPIAAANSFVVGKNPLQGICPDCPPSRTQYPDSWCIRT